MRAKLLISVALILVTAATYAGVRNNGFLTFDDDRYVTQNAHVRDGLTLEGLGWALQTTTVSNWHPLAWWGHMLDVELFGLEPAGHHASNVGLHIANSVALLWLLVALTGALWRSAFVAALFALHPLHVESVAWVAEKKDVLSTLFWLASVAAYARYARTGGLALYAGALISFGLALMSKSMAMTLPFALLLLDVWPLDRLRLFEPDRWSQLGRIVAEKLPFFALALAAGIVALQTQSGAVWTLDQLPLPTRLANAAVAYLRYVGHFVWPVDLAIFYPHPQRWPLPGVSAASALLVAASAGALWQLRARPYLAVGWFFFLGTLVPVIGLVQIGNQAMADRYMYLPLLGLAIIAGWGAFDLFARFPRAQPVLAGLAAIALAAGAALTFRYVPLWVDTLTIFEHALETTSENPTAHNTVGWHRSRRGEYKVALAHFDEALRIAPSYALAHFNRGTTLYSVGDTAGSIAALERSLQLRTDYAPAYFALGVAYETNRQYAKAADAYRQGLQLEPGSLVPMRRLTLLLVMRSDMRNGDEAVALATRIAAITQHKSARDLDLLAAAHAASGDYDDAVQYAERAEELARRSNDTALADAIAAHAARYRRGEALQ